MSTPSGSPATAAAVSLVRKCLGKNKASECLQNAEHQNTRWECNFETQSKEEYLKHLKNSLKRVKWRDLVEGNKPDKDGWYRCVYFSTDRHHVENHYQKGNDSYSPSPQNAGKGKSSKRWVNFSGKRDMDDDDDETPEFAAREMKKLKQDASLLGFFQEQHAMAESNVEALPDTTKTEELMEAIEKKLELNHDMAALATEKLQKQGYKDVLSLKGITKEGWDKLDLPLAIEEEIKNQITTSAYNPWYGIPFAWSFHQGGYWPTYNSNGQPIYYPGAYPANLDGQESVIGSGEIADKDKEKSEESIEGTGHVNHEPSATSQLVALVSPDEKKENGDSTTKEQRMYTLPPLESIKVDLK